MGGIPVLLPLFVALALIGSSLGLTSDQIEGKYVYFATSDTDPVETVLTGAACNHDWDAIVGPEFIEACAGLPSQTAVLFPLGWSAGEVRIAYLIRHEVEHLLRGPDGPPEDVWDEAAATAAGCAASWDPGFCY
jgi:hypothetical protein